MTTLLISEIFPPKTGGSSRWFWEIYRRVPVKEMVIASGEDSQQDSFDRSHDLRVTRLPLSFSDWGVFSARTLRQYWDLSTRIAEIIKTEGIDDIHCGRALPEGWIAWMIKQRYGLSYLCYAHGEEINLNSVGQSSGVLSSRQLRWMTRTVLRSADLVIANTRNSERILLNDWILPESKVRIMHPGVDTNQFVPAERSETERARLGWKERQVVLTVGRLETRKGHDQMILALHAIKITNPAVLYSIVGDGERREFLRALVDKEGLTGHVQFLGELNDEELLACYQQCDLFVLPNRQVGNDIEGFGMVLLEAQACAKAVVAGDSGGTAETLKIPETGRVVPCESPERLAAVVVELLNNHCLRAQMGQAGRKWVVEKFDWTVLSRRAAELFQNRFDGGARRLRARPVESSHRV